MKKVNFKDKFKKFSDQWSPKVIAELNDYQFKLVKIQNDFIWHKHVNTLTKYLLSLKVKCLLNLKLKR